MWRRGLLCVPAVLLAVLQSAAAAAPILHPQADTTHFLPTTPYRCKSPGAHPLSEDLLLNEKIIFGAKFGTSALQFYLRTPTDNYTVTVSEYTMSITLLDFSPTFLGSNSTHSEQRVLVTKPSPRNLVQKDVVRYFWVRVRPTNVSAPVVETTDVTMERSGEMNEIAFGLAGNEDVLLSMQTLPDKTPSTIEFPAYNVFVFNCSSAPVLPVLACRKHTLTRRYDFSEMFPVAEELIYTTGGMRLIRFMVKGIRDAHVRLRGTGFSPYYEIDLNFVHKIAIQKGAIYLNATQCIDCMSPHEFRLFTIVFDASRLELYEGTNIGALPRITVNIQQNFNITSIGFASMNAPATVQWLHACQGYPKAMPREDEPVYTMSPPLPPSASQNDTVGCRVVHTFKYNFDGYFALAEEGRVGGTTSVLPFWVKGRRDVHLQLVSSIPPIGENYYEIDIDFYNNTNVDRGRTKVASIQTQLLSPTKMRAFVLVHDSVTGVLNITAMDGDKGVPVVVWRDPMPFPLRYFSICSGSIAGNDTTWMFGCPTYRGVVAQPNSCSRPLSTYRYSHSQYLSFEREGVVQGSQRSIRLFVRAKGSAHIRLESVLPPPLDPLFEVDLNHEGNTSIDFLGKQMASVATPGLLSETESRGFWLRQDMTARRLEVGRDGVRNAILTYTAPAGARFPEVRLFSLATSRSVNNGTWFYGCKGDSSPANTSVVDTPEDTWSHEDFDFDSDEDASPLFPPFTLTPAMVPHSNEHHFSASRSLSFHFRMIDQPPAVGTTIGLQLTVHKVYLDDVSGAVVVRGHLFAAWNDENIKWEPREYEDIRVVNSIDLGWTWVPDLTVTNGELDLGGVVHLHHSGAVRWEASLHARAFCAMDGRRWPLDQHECELTLGLAGGGGGRILHLLGEHTYLSSEHNANASRRTWVKEGAAAPLWHLQSMTVAVADSADSTGQRAMGTSLRILATLQRRTPVLHHVLLAPFVVLAAISLLAYWVSEPLPRDKAVLGSGSLVLVVLAFLVLEAACPPALVGMPAIVEAYCWCVSVVALTVVTSAVTTALGRDAPLRKPPALMCKLLSVPLLRWILMLHADQISQRFISDELRPDAEGYKKMSPQVYTQFDQERMSDCRCGNRECCTQVAMEAQYYWTLLALACERVLSIISFVLLIIAAILVK